VIDFTTSDLSDAHGDALRIADPIFSDFGARTTFAGPVATVKVFEDNALVRSRLESPGEGRVLVVDGGGSLRRALVGDVLVSLAVANGWEGLVVYGCIRDRAEMATMPFGIKALAAHPRRSDKTGSGYVDVPVTFAGVTFTPGAWLYADADGIAVSARPLH